MKECAQCGCKINDVEVRSGFRFKDGIFESFVACDKCAELSKDKAIADFEKHEQTVER